SLSGVTAPLRFEDGVLHILDQTRLPAEEVWLPCESPEQVADAIRRLAVRGAPAIGVAAAYGLALAPPSAFDAAAELLASGRLTAWELERAGIPFQVIIDSSAGLLMARGQVDRVVVGADRIAANGDVANKIGTYPLAVLAARHGIPFVVAAPTSTIDPDTPTGDDIPIEERDPAEVSANGFPAANFAFDVTPAELVSVVVTEEG